MAKRMLPVAVLLAIVVVGVGVAATVAAMNNVFLQGSEELESVVKDVLSHCPGAVAKGITFVATGSNAGENAMSPTAGPPLQTIAPMARFLGATPGVCAKGATAQGLVIGLDGLAIVASADEAGKCGGGLAHGPTRSFQVTDTSGSPVVDCAACDPGTNTYRLIGWQDVLALIFAGQPHAGNADCAGAVRRSLVDNWGALFESACAGGQCTRLRHAFRRSDVASNSQALLQLIGMAELPAIRFAPGAVARPVAYCNAFGMGNIFAGDDDYVDNDPIRRTCAPEDEVCSRDGTLGLVLVTEVPGDLAHDALYTPLPCTPGKFRLVNPAPSRVTICPNGRGLLFSKCFLPYRQLDDGSVTSNCIAPAKPVQGFGANGMDGRAYNLVVRRADFRYLVDNINRFVTGAFYRIHANRVIASGGAPCAKDSSSDQIGCLVQADPCSVGVADRDADQQAGAVALAINGVADTVANIEKIVTAPADPTFYPLSRKLYLNSVIGFGDPALQDGELELARCFSSAAIMNPIMVDRRFLPVPGGIFCQDFDEQAGCGAPTNSNACASNPVGVVPNL